MGALQAIVSPEQILFLCVLCEPSFFFRRRDAKFKKNYFPLCMVHKALGGAQGAKWCTRPSHNYEVVHKVASMGPHTHNQRGLDILKQKFFFFVGATRSFKKYDFPLCTMVHRAQSGAQGAQWCTRPPHTDEVVHKVACAGLAGLPIPVLTGVWGDSHPVLSWAMIH